MSTRATLILIVALAIAFVGMDDLREVGAVHGIEREGDIPLP